MDEQGGESNSMRSTAVQLEPLDEPVLWLLSVHSRQGDTTPHCPLISHFDRPSTAQPPQASPQRTDGHSGRVGRESRFVYRSQRRTNVISSMQLGSHLQCIRMRLCLLRGRQMNALGFRLVALFPLASPSGPRATAVVIGRVAVLPQRSESAGTSRCRSCLGAARQPRTTAPLSHSRRRLSVPPASAPPAAAECGRHFGSSAPRRRCHHPHIYYGMHSMQRCSHSSTYSHRHSQETGA